MASGNPSAAESVRHQYEAFPYPPRDPADERKRLRRTYIDTLEVINHYLFGGRRDFRQGIRVLVAGGGTGDSTIHLAEQLRGLPGEVVYLDLSRASLEVARQRAEIRGLTNLHWVNGSLTELPRLGLGKFDYINCCGVLHHLPEPEAGLAALRGALADGGGLGLMVYGRYGRTGIYQVQQLLRYLNADHPDADIKLDRTRQCLRSLPASNWHQRGKQLFLETEMSSDADLYDLFLHAVDRAYSVPELHDFLRTAGLHWIEFTPELRTRYEPAMVLGDPELIAAAAQRPLVEQQAIAELAIGSIMRHEFFASPDADAAASCDDLEQVPFFSLAALTQGSVLAPGEWVLRFARTVELRTRASLAAQRVVELVDGRRTLGEIVQQLANELPGLGLPGAFQLVREVFDLLHKVDGLLLHRRDVPLARPLDADDPRRVADLFSRVGG
ncbi:MAG: class I SAM-dependent methyltransferase [Pirellulales bacterium]|nr:class I SAM-dependent methyltransferase [Pirellulales bacterium]